MKKKKYNSGKKNDKNSENNRQNNLEGSEKEDNTKGDSTIQDNEFKPLKMIGSLFLALMIILMIIPFYNIRLDPEPKNIPSIDDVIDAESLRLLLHLENTENSKKTNDLRMFLNPSIPLIKQTANKIAGISCTGIRENSKVCNAKAIFYFVRDNFNYVSDPVNREYFQTCAETLSSRSGDCDDFTILTANLMRAIGINTRFVLVSGHVYLQIYLPEAIASYKDNKTDWINIDPTCSNCDFGKLTLETKNKEKLFVG